MDEAPSDTRDPYVLVDCVCPPPPNAHPNCPPCPQPEPIGLPSPPEESTPDGLAGVLSLDVGALGTWVDLDDADTGIGGGLGLHIAIFGYEDFLTYRALANGMLGYETTGFLSRFAGDASVGPALSLGASSRLFARVSLEAASHKDDELDTSVYTFPTAFVGLQLTSEAVLFELGPRAGAALRAVYAPGNETDGRRYHRDSRVALSWGGSASFVSPYVFFDATLTRVEETRGLWLARGYACTMVPPPETEPEGFIVCAFADHLRGVVTGPAGERADVGSWVVGASFGFGFSQIRLQR